MKAIITVGVSASGKTTWAKAQSGFVVISRNDIRREILEVRHNRQLRPGELWKLWKWKDENLVTAKVDTDIAFLADRGQDIIVADTNLNTKHRDALALKLKWYGYEVEYKHFTVTFEEAIRRDAGRADGVGHSVIWKQFKQWYDAMGGTKYVPDTSLPKAVIFDVDGTLAKMNGRGPFDWHRVDEDDVREEIAVMFQGFKAAGYKMIVLSGRDSVCFDKTSNWLADNEIFYDEMFMREEGDMRKDNIIKEELFSEHIAHKYNVKMVVDDRPQVVRQWQLMGLPVAAVANQYEEF